jgi:hypothetical protein
MIKQDIILYLNMDWNSKFFDIDHLNTLDNIIDGHVFHQKTLQLYKSTRPHHHKDNQYLPFVATGCLKMLDFNDDLRILKLLSKYNDMDRFTSESLLRTACMIDAMYHVCTQDQSKQETCLDILEDDEYGKFDVEIVYG